MDNSIQNTIPMDSNKLATRLSQALRATASVINSSLRLGEVLHLILESVGQVVPHDAANIMLIEEDHIAVVRACKGYENLGGNERVIGNTCSVDRIPNLNRMMRTGKPIVITDTTKSPDWIIFERSSWIRSYTSTPIRLRGETIGFINLNSCHPGQYNLAHAENLLAFADQAAVAIHNARLFEAAEREINERKAVEITLQKTLNELEMRVEMRTRELRRANERLLHELELRREAEVALEQERSQLADRVAERTIELSSANAELARAAQLKDNFLTSMSHELRTPLNAILNISETLQEQVFGDLNERQLRLTHTIEESGRHLLALINDILDLSKIGAGKLELLWDTVSVPMICEASVKMIREAANKKNLKVGLNIDPAIHAIRADHRRLKQILVNLLSNAVKFTPEGGELGLEVTCDPERQQAHFVVWDHGIGIAKDDLKLLFQSFTQLNNGLSRQYEGTGLGLALVYHLVELHGGGIRVESEQGVGSRFTFTLPWALEASTPLETSASNLPAAEPETPPQPEDPVVHLTRSLNSLGIEVLTCWADVTRPPRLTGTGSLGARPNAGLIVIDPSFEGNESSLIQNLWKSGLSPQNPILVISNHSKELAPDLARLSSTIQTLSPTFSQQELRSALRQASPNTASLIDHAALIHRKEKPRNSTNGTILVVDDNAVYTRMLADYLEYKGYRPVLAFDGSDALDRAREDLPDLILMDIQMPGMDGLETIRQIRATQSTRNIPIVALTALAMPDDKTRCMAAGANDYLSKPLPLKTVLAMISKYLPADSGAH